MKTTYEEKLERLIAYERKEANEEGLEKGREEGREEGAEENRTGNVRRLVPKGLSD